MPEMARVNQLAGRRLQVSGTLCHQYTRDIQAVKLKTTELPAQFCIARPEASEQDDRMKEYARAYRTLRPKYVSMTISLRLIRRPKVNLRG
jgi:hypothetical protein